MFNLFMYQMQDLETSSVCVCRFLPKNKGHNLAMLPTHCGHASPRGSNKSQSNILQTLKSLDTVQPFVQKAICCFLSHSDLWFACVGLHSQKKINIHIFMNICKSMYSLV